MDAAEARKLAMEVHGITPDQTAGISDAERDAIETVRFMAQAGWFQAAVDITPFHLSPGKQSLLIITLRGKGYSCHPRTEDGRTILDIGW